MGRYNLIYIGILLVFIGFITDVIFAGIPYQDAPIELVEKYNFYLNLSKTIYAVGLIVLIIGVINKLLKKLVK